MAPARAHHVAVPGEHFSAMSEARSISNTGFDGDLVVFTGILYGFYGDSMGFNFIQLPEIWQIWGYMGIPHISTNAPPQQRGACFESKYYGKQLAEEKSPISPTSGHHRTPIGWSHPG